MMAVLYVLIDEGLIVIAFVDKYAHGFDELEKHILGITDGVAKKTQWAENICGTPAERAH